MSYSLHYSLVELGFVFSVLLELPSPLTPHPFLSFEADRYNSSNLFVMYLEVAGRTDIPVAEGSHVSITVCTDKKP